jgi:WD40 repeat protein/DNA replication protein DnaC
MSHHDNALSELIWAIEASAGQFSLMLAHCNYAELRQNIAKQLLKKTQILPVDFPADKSSLFKALSAGIGQNPEKMPVMVCRLELAHYLDDVMKSANNDREEFRRNFSFPLILWVNDNVFIKMMKNAPDFENWSTSVHFTPSDEELLEMLSHAVSLSDRSLHKNREQLELFLKDIEKRQLNLTPELQANLQFLYGKHEENNNHPDADPDAAIKCYKQSLELGEKNPENKRILLYSIAGFYKKKKEWEKAKAYFQECLEMIKIQDELSVKCMCELAEVLMNNWKENDWKELEKLSENALQISQTCGYTNECRRCYRFLAEVALRREDWQEAEKQTQHILDSFYPDEAQDKKPSLADAENILECLKNKIKSLEYADAEIFIGMLDLLRRIYFHKKKYWESFQIKQEKYSLEQQFGFRAFIGAGRLKARRFIADETRMAEEIEASGRKDDIDKLLAKITSGSKVIVFHGQSGVGKSSILEAGLEPALRRLSMRDYDDVRPILIRNYTDWVKELSEKISDKPLSTKEILVVLNEFNRKQFLTVLIFDQFEEFFFAHPDSAKRQEFYDFLYACVNNPVVRLIFSLREDYLHYLLEMERIIKLEIFIDEKQGILAREFRYSLGNFSVEGAKDVIKSLTRRSQFVLDDKLIDKIVEDLAKGSEGVRPIELQIVGFQIEGKPMKKYRPKQELVEEFVRQVYQDCGKENEKLAELTLYLLTDENNTRPLKSKDEIVSDLRNSGYEDTAQLDLVLKILEGSGIVVFIKGKPARYQLVHDYLVDVIRKGDGKKLLSELKTKKEKRKEVVRIVLIVSVLLAISAFGYGVTEKKNALKIEEQRKIADSNGKKSEENAKEALEQRQIAEQKTREALGQRQAAEKIALQGIQALLRVHDELGALLIGIKSAKMTKQIKMSSEYQNATVLQKLFRNIHEKNRLEGYKSPVRSVAFSPDGKKVASGHYFDKMVRLWNADTGEKIATLEGHENDVCGVSFSPDGKTLASAGKDNDIILWNVEDGNKIKTLEGHKNDVYSISFSPDGKTLASAGRDKSIILWDVEKHNEISLLKHDKNVLSVCFSPDGKFLASADRGGKIKLWDVSDKNNISDKKTLIGNKNAEDAVWTVCFSPDGKTLASGGGQNRTIKLWNIEKDGTVKIPTEHTDIVYSVTFSPDGKALASAGRDNTLIIWDISDIGNVRVINRLNGHTNWIYSISFSSDKNILASGSLDNTIKLWSLEEFNKDKKSDLDEFLKLGCKWLHGYLKYNPNISEEDRCLCDDILSKP